tara:strand:+ start:7152 stop:11987 length:4836 start_codon:yes stop_codon:yes gene_type:complete
MAGGKIDFVSFVKGRMNKSIDERLLPEGEYVDAQNVRLGSTESTEIGAVENSRGNEQLTTLSFGGQPLSNSARCIGALEDGAQETIYWFVHDPANNVVAGGKLDMIVSFNTTTSQLRYHVITASVLNFDPEFLVTGVNKIENLLFFTDDKNPPRRINVNENYPFTTALGVDGIEEEDISVILKPPGFEDSTPSGDTPLTVPRVTLINATGGENFIEDRFISFAYRYRYKNGEYSATSLFTNPAFQPSNFRFDTRNFDNAGMSNTFNGARVEFSTGSDRVIEVDLLYKDSNTNSIYVIERFNKADFGWGNNQHQEYVFTNSKIYSVLGSDELLRLYDNVPRLARAQTIMGNRLFYGNYVDGYNITSETGQDIAVNYNASLLSQSVDFEVLPNGVLTQGSTYSINPSTSTVVQNSLCSFDLSSIATKLKQGATLSLTLRYQHAELNGTTTTNCFVANTGFKTADTTIVANILLTADYSSVFDFSTSADFTNAIGTVLNQNFEPIATASQGTSLTDAFNAALVPPSTTCSFTTALTSINDSTTQQGFAITCLQGSNTISLQILATKFISSDLGQSTELYEYYRFLRGSAEFSSDSNKNTLHSNRDFEVGIVYLDEFARASTVLVSEYNTVYVPPANSIFKNRINVAINSYAPSFAKKYKFVVKPSKSGYETIFTNFFYTNPFDNVTHFKLDGDNQNKVQTGDKLIVKKDVDGALASVVEATVLDVKGQPSNFLNNANELGEDSEQLAGLYMQIKVSNFNAVIEDDSIMDYGKFERGNKTENVCSNKLTVSYPLYVFTPASGATPASTTNYTIPGGSIINLRFGFKRRDNGIGGAPQREAIFEKSFVADSDYNDFRDWFNNTNIDVNDLLIEIGVGTGAVMTYDSAVVSRGGPGGLDPNQASTGKNAHNVPCNGQIFTGKLAFIQDIPGDATSPLFLGFRCPGKGSDSNFGLSRDMKVFIDIVVQRADSTIVFETQPADASEGIFLDASQTFDVVRDGSGVYLHQSGGNVDLGEQNQTTSQDAVVSLDFMDCYTFGNGVESYKYQDRLASRSVVMGQRALAVSNQDFKEADRFASVTYSGKFGFSSGINNLNEFNLGLVNFQDVETSFGPINKFHGRETDILCLQEDRISYVQSGKDLISDSVGGGAIVSTPTVLGKQIARIEEYGISYNPESFVQWGKYMYFTDTKRLAVLRLGASGQLGSDLTVISDTGMRSWFRDTFIAQLNTQKLGGFDPYMDEYVLSTNQRPVPIPVPNLDCDVQIDFTALTNAVTYTINYGQTVGVGEIEYNITSGTIKIDVTWNSVTTSSGNVTGTGSFTFNKSAGSPSTALISIVPIGSPTPSFSVTPKCIPQTEITVIKAVINSPNDNAETIHVEYSWNDGVTFSPIDSDLAVLGNSPVIFSEYLPQTGVRSQGVFPYDGVNLSIRLNKVNFDTYDFIFPSDNFRFLSSNTLFQNNTTDVASLLAASTQIPNGSVTNPSPGLHQATVSNLSLPIGNQYLYIIYDLRTVGTQQLCYDASSADDACCLCTWNCVAFSISPVGESAALVCSQVLSNTNYHNGSGALPAIGDLVYTSSNCEDVISGTVNYAVAGFYKINNSPNQYIIIGANGLVIDLQNC